VIKKRKKICRFCEKQVKRIDYRDDRILNRYISDRGKIVPGRVTGVCAKHQRWLSRAIKRGRVMGLLPFTSREFSNR
jgi:small subunit ribosomal protein S18